MQDEGSVTKNGWSTCLSQCVVGDFYDYKCLYFARLNKNAKLHVWKDSEKEVIMRHIYYMFMAGGNSCFNLHVTRMMGVASLIHL